MGFITDIFTADKAADAQKDASRDSARASQYATDQTVALNRDIFNRIWTGTQVQRDAGDAATRMMASLMGLNIPASASPGAPQTLPAPNAPTPNAPAGANQSNSPLNVLSRIRGGRSQTGYDAIDTDTITDPDSGGPVAPPPAPPFPVTGGDAGPQINYGPGNEVGGSPNAPVNPTAPTTTAGPANPGNALNPGQSPTDWLRSTPGYQFNFDEGSRALNAGLASRGRLFSGDAGREAIRYGQNYGDRIYSDQWNRLAGIAGAGQTATSQGNAAGQSYAGNAGNAFQNNAANLSSSYQNRGNAISGFWGNVNGSINNAGNAFAQIMGGF